MSTSSKEYSFYASTNESDFSMQSNKSWHPEESFGDLARHVTQQRVPKIERNLVSQKRPAVVGNQNSAVTIKGILQVFLKVIKSGGGSPATTETPPRKTFGGDANEIKSPFNIQTGCGRYRGSHGDFSRLSLLFSGVSGDVISIATMPSFPKHVQKRLITHRHINVRNLRSNAQERFRY